MAIFTWFIVGAFAGLLARAYVGGLGYGVIGDVVGGVAGAVLGGSVFRVLRLPLPLEGRAGTLLVAFFGALVFILLIRVLRPGRRLV